MDSVAGKMEKSWRAEEFDGLIVAGGSVPGGLVDAVIADYPYFLPALIAAAGQNEDRERIVRMCAVSMADRAALCDIIGPEAGKFKNFYPGDTEKKKSTMDTISHFLDTFGDSDDSELKALEQRIFNPVPDYAQLLEKEERGSVPCGEELDSEKTSGNELLINRFIALSKRQEGHFPAKAGEEPAVPQEVADAPSPKALEEHADNSMLSESLAKIYIRRKRYEKALEIIVSLSLNFPEKSIYFADQIRFLRKLIVNEKYKNKK